MSRATKQGILTVVVRIRAGMVERLRTTLDQIGSTIEQNDYIRFQDLTTVHFCRYVLIPEDVDAPPSLVFACNYDGQLNDLLGDLIRAGGKGLDAIYGHCEGYPPRGAADPAAVKAFLRAHAVDYEAYYASHPGLSVDAIRNDSQVREIIQNYLNHAQKAPGWPTNPHDIRARIQETLKQHPELRTDLSSRTLPTWQDALPWLVPTGLGTLFLLPTVATVVGVLAVLLRYHEEHDVVKPPPARDIMPLVKQEDIFVQNQMSHLVRVKPGLFRFITLKNVLFTIHQAARYLYNEGHLAGIPTIHFAHWVLLDRGKRLLFLSNYDGSWESYLSDFIGMVSYGLTGVWSNTEGFPPTRWLFNEGATHEEHFKQWTRAHQIPTQVWYAAYPHISVTNITNNEAIRKCVEGKLSESEILEWLQRL